MEREHLFADENILFTAEDLCLWLAFNSLSSVLPHIIFLAIACAVLFKVGIFYILNHEK
jgi:hypothetical protein